MVGRFWVLVLSHAAPGFQLWFYFRLCMRVVLWGLAPEAALEGLGLPHEGQVWRWHSCLGRRDSGSTRDSGGLAARAAEIYHSRRVWQPVLANTLQYSCLENPLPDREAWQATVYTVSELGMIEATLHA